MTKLAVFAAVALGAYLATGLFLAFSLDRIMYYPHRGFDALPKDFGLKAEEVTFAASDGTSLFGWYFSQPRSRAVLIFLHGNAGNISHRLGIVKLLLTVPADIFLFDYRGYGMSEGRPSGEEPFLDARAALENVRSREDSSGKKIILLGESLGGSIALLLAAGEKVDGVVSVSAFASTRDVVRSMPLYRVFSFIVPNRFNAIASMARVGAPILFVHGTDDEVIPFSHGDLLYAAAGGEKERYWVKGGRHNDLFDVAGTEIADRIGRFLEKLAGPAR